MRPTPGPIGPRVTVFEEMSALAEAHGAINLGQGFPDGAGPESLRAAAARAIVDGPHHYPRMRGVPALRAALARFYAGTQGLALDPETDIVVTSGATEAIAAAILALLAPGDEAMLLAPAYDAYAPLVRRAGAVPVEVALQPPAFALTAERLAAALSARTRLVIVNDPVNPTGRRLSAHERGLIADLAAKHGLFILADEVWEEVRPPGTRHESLLGEPRVADRVVKIGSAGKIFELTGWKVGWALSSAPLAARVAATHQYLTFTTPPALQQAVAEALGTAGDWIAAMRARNAASRARLGDGLAAAGWAVLPSEATWFLCVDLPASGIARSDVETARALVTGHGVAAIPVSSFYEGDGRPTGVLRFCHAKAPATIDAALERLARARPALACA